MRLVRAYVFINSPTQDMIAMITTICAIILRFVALTRKGWLCRLAQALAYGHAELLASKILDSRRLVIIHLLNTSFLNNQSQT